MPDSHEALLRNDFLCLVNDLLSRMPSLMSHRASLFRAIRVNLFTASFGLMSVVLCLVLSLMSVVLGLDLSLMTVVLGLVLSFRYYLPSTFGR